MPLLLVWLFLTVTKLKSIEVPEPDFTLSTSGCGPCWESAPPNEVLVFIPALLMAGAHHVFPWEPGIHYLAFFLCVSFFLHLPFTRWGGVLSLQVSGPRVPIFRHSHHHGCVRGGPGLAVWEAEPPASCIAHLPWVSPWWEGTGEELEWALPLIMLC